MNNQNLTTTELLKNLKQVNNLEEYFSLFDSELSRATFNDILNSLLFQKELVVSDVLRKTNITKSYIYKIFSGEKKPSRDHIIQIAIGMKCTLIETNMLLRKLEYSALYPRSSRDSILIYAIEKDFTVYDTNDLLISHAQKPFFDTDI